MSPWGFEFRLCKGCNRLRSSVRHRLRMEKHSLVPAFRGAAPYSTVSNAPTSPPFTRWSPEGVERTKVPRAAGHDDTMGTLDRWSGVLSDDVALVGKMCAEQKQAEKMREAAQFATYSPVSVSTPNLAALIEGDNFQLPKATLMIDSLIDAPMSRSVEAA